MRLAGKVALVTGGGSGIGRAIALAYQLEGARVAVVDRNGAAAEAAAAAAGRDTRAFVADVSSAEDVRAMVSATTDAFGRLDVLVNSAAIQLHDRDARCHELSEEAWEETLRVNLRGPFLCMKYAIPALMRSGGRARRRS
jgi:NAD(P)-dependent dehydrogenase (short-subunit alcohol dehydrogenase family)